MDEDHVAAITLSSSDASSASLSPRREDTRSPFFLQIVFGWYSAALLYPSTYNS